YFSSRNKIHHNLISANDIGVQLINSSNNFIYRNVISRNPLGMDIYYY
ncbi:right-handed parallel beta-helix repeat-containing protein, partial [Candidatus Bathyarchaeota archaeon]|nr:right-handed parallel beta-helix repeat-containing protein [Candidatus Bathyarchaeota archaeon]